MALQNTLPDRGLTDNEFRQLQAMDSFDAVLRDDAGGLATYIFLQKDGEETALHYTEDDSWHIHHQNVDLDNPHSPIDD